jgi:hypothetical protein
MFTRIGEHTASVKAHDWGLVFGWVRAEWRTMPLLFEEYPGSAALFEDARDGVMLAVFEDTLGGLVAAELEVVSFLVG